jgi:hypothetical protein
MRIWLSLAAIALAASLSACGAKSGALAPLKTTPEKVEAYVAKLSTEPFKVSAKGAADMASVRDALPKEISLTWAKADFDAASGATVLTDVKLTPAGVPEIGVSMAEVRLWEFDAAFAKARLGGQRLTETASLARRIEAKGISLFGLETLVNSAMAGMNEAMTSAITDAVKNAGPDAAAQITADMDDVKLDSYELSIARVVFDDVVLRPYEIKPVTLPAGSEYAELMQVAQPYAAVMRTLAVDTMAMFDFKGQFAMTDAGQPVTMDFTLASSAARGVRGGDADVSIARDMALDMSITPEGMAKPMKLAAAYDAISTQGVRLDKLYSYLAMGEWPKRTDKDLLKIDSIASKGERWTINSHPVYSVAESKTEMPGWQWFIPTKLRYSASNIVYDVKGVIDLVDEMGPEFAAEPFLQPIPDPAAPKPPAAPATPAATPAPTVPPEVMALLSKYGLEHPSMDVNFGWTWNPTTGGAVVDTAFGLDDYLRFNVKYEGGMPSFKAVSDLIPEDNPEAANEAAINKVFETATTLKAVEFGVVDEGGLQKIFGLASEAAKMVPADQAGGVGPLLDNQSPSSLRTMASTVVYAAADEAAKVAPEFKALITPFAVFIEKGGKVKFTAKAAKPLSYAAMEHGELTLAQVVKALKAKTVHTPPAGK